MASWSVSSVLVVLTGWLLLSLSLAADDPAANSANNGTTNSSSTAGPGSTAAPRPTPLSGGTTTTRKGAFGGLGVDSSMIQRAFYVLIAITIIGVLYFLVRAVRLKKPAQRKKYGLLSNYDDSVEMEAVESEDDDTLYEARSLRR